MDILSACITVVAAAIIMTSYINVLKVIAAKDDVDQLARKYILEMETLGYLSVASEVQLRQELTDLGATQIDLSGTTYTDAGYGNTVYLKIKCNLSASALNMSGGNMMRFFFEETAYPVEVQRMSTAKN